MGFFFQSPKPRVTREEFRRFVRSGLASQGLLKKEIDFIEGMIEGSIDSSIEREKGVDARELDRIVVWLKTNKTHTLSPAQIDIFEKEMKKRMG